MKPVTIHTGLSFLLKFILLIEAIVAVWEQQWFTALITLGIIVIALTPFTMAKASKFFCLPSSRFWQLPLFLHPYS